MDIQSLFFNVFDAIKQKLTEEEWKQYINAQDYDGNTALLYASFKGTYEIVNELILNGADINLRNTMGLSVMHMASQGDKPNILIYFKDKYNLSVIDKDNVGNTPLHWACHTTSESSISFLLTWMENVNVQDDKGQTPLHISIHTFKPKIIKKLLLCGADVNLKNSAGESVLSIVTSNKTLNPDFENILLLITDTKPMKICFMNQRGNTIFNSKMFILIHFLCESSAYFILLPCLSSYLIDIIFLTLIFLLVIIFLFTHFSNPGKVVCKDSRTWLEIVEAKTYLNGYCPYCKIQKTVSIKHCHSCKQCVNEFDHHCNWIDNCVGGNNWGKFLIFVIVVLINLGFCYYISLMAFLIKNKDISKGDEYFHLFGFSLLNKLHAKDHVALVIMTICIFFFIPVSYVLWIQIRNRLIRKRKTKVNYPHI